MRNDNYDVEIICSDFTANFKAKLTIPPKDNIFTLSFEDQTNLLPLYNWFSKIYDSALKFDPLTDKAKITLKKEATLTFEGCWPQSINFGQLDFSNSDILTIEVTFRYDKFEKNVATTE